MAVSRQAAKENFPALSGPGAAPAGIEPFALRMIDPGHIPALNAFYRRRSWLKIMVGAQSLELLASSAPACEAHPATILQMSVGESKCRLQVPEELLGICLEHLVPDFAIDLLEPDHAVLVVESVLADEFGYMEDALGVPIAIRAIGEPKQMPGPELDFTIRRKGQSFRCSVGLSDLSHVLALAKLMDTRATPHLLPDDFLMPVSVWLGSAGITIGELRCLSSGDVVLLDGSCHPDAFLVVGAQLVAPVEFIGEGVRLTGKPGQLKDTNWDRIMDQTTPEALATEYVNLDDLPVSLVFEIGRTSLSVAEVQRLGPGVAVSLADMAMDFVTILANGRCVGRGEIVRIGEGLAVRVTGIFDNA